MYAIRGNAFINKSRRSGVLFGSEGQYVGSPIDIYEQLQFVIDCSRFLPFGVVNLEPQLVCTKISRRRISDMTQVLY